MIKQKKGKIRIKNVVLFAVYLIILVLLIEISLRIFYPQPVFKRKLPESFPRIYETGDYLPFKLKPNSKDYFLGPIDEFNASVEINSKGYRDYEFDVEKKIDEYRILFLGDSFTFGWAVELEETYHKQLEKRLNSNYEVISAGWVSGQSPDTAYLYLKKEGIELNPDMVIIGVYIGNDFDDYKTYKHILEFDENGDLESISSDLLYVDEENRLRMIEIDNRNFLKKALYKINVFLTFKSHFYTLFKNSFRKPLSFFYSGKPSVDVSSQIYTDEIRKDIDYNLDFFLKIKNLTDRNNISLVLVLIPYEEQVYGKKIRDESNLLKNWTKPSEFMKDFGLKNDILIIDLLPYFNEYVKNNEEKLYFSGDGHWNRNGHRLAGKILYDELNKLQWR